MKIRVRTSGVVRLVAVLAVLSASLLARDAASNERAPQLPDVPNVNVALTVSAPESTSRARTNSAPDRPATTRNVTTQPKDSPVTEPAVPETEEPSAPKPTGKLVREWHVLYSRSGGAEDSSNATPCPRASTCDRYGLRQPRWPTDESGRAVIAFAYNDDGRRPARAADGITRPALAAAMREWGRWNSNIAFQDVGTTTSAFGADGSDGTCDDGTNVVTWRNFDPSVIGAAILCFDETGKVIRDSDLALNAAQHWERVSGEPDSRHSHDIQSILTHELGHWFALQDLYTEEASKQTMAGNTKYGETRKRTLALGDIVALQKAYPCGAEDNCPREGIKDD